SPAAADPPDPARRDAAHQPIGEDAAPDHRARPDQGVLPDGNAADDRRIGTDRGPSLHQGALVLVFARDVAPGSHHVGEHAARSTEHVVLQLHALVDGDIVLDLHVRPDAGARHHHHVLPQIAALADDRARHHVAEVPDLGSPADDGAVVDVGGLVNEVVCHEWPVTLTWCQVLGVKWQVTGHALATAPDSLPFTWCDVR